MSETEQPVASQPAPVVHQGTKELTELLDGVLAVVKAGMDIAKDGKVGFDDISHVVGLVPKLVPAFDGLAKLPGEVSDLSAEEAAALIAHVMANLAVDDAKAKAIVEASLKVLVSGYGLVLAIKG